MSINKLHSQTKLLVTLIFNFLSEMCKSKGQRNQFQTLGKCSIISYVFEFVCLLECEPTLIMKEFPIEKKTKKIEKVLGHIFLILQISIL